MPGDSDFHSVADNSVTNEAKRLSEREITKDELSKHASEKDCWVAVHGKVSHANNILTLHLTN